MIREHFSIILAYKLILHDRRVYFQADTFGGSKVQHFGNAACLCQAKPRQKNGALLALFLCRIRIPTLRCLLEIFVLKVRCLMSLFIFKFSGPPNHVVWHQVWGDFHFIHSFFDVLTYSSNSNMCLYSIAAIPQMTCFISCTSRAPLSTHPTNPPRKRMAPRNIIGLLC